MSSAARAESVQRPGPALVRGPRPLQPAARAPELFGGLRVVRTLAMLSIVGYHVTWAPIFGIAFGLTSLQVVMCALASRAASPRPARTFLRRRARRLLAPWLAWCAIHAAFEIGRRTLAGQPPLGWLEPWMWASGTSFHLWFLPFGFAASLAVHAAQRLFRAPRPATQALAASLAGVLLLLAADPLKLTLRPATPFDLWIDGLPTLAFGLAVGRALSIPDPVSRAKLLLAVSLAGLVPLVLGGSLLPASGLHERYAVAVPFVCLGLIVPVPDLRWLAALAATNLGVYLVHMLAIRIADHVPGFAELPGLWRSGGVYVLCLGTVLALRRLPIAWLT